MSNIRDIVVHVVEAAEAGLRVCTHELIGGGRSSAVRSVWELIVAHIF